MSHERNVESESEPETSNLTASALEEEGMNDEGIFLVEKAETEAQEAYTVPQQAKTTLKEARAKQHQDEPAQAEVQGITCFRCGRPHKIAVCPDKHAPKIPKEGATTRRGSPL